MRRLFQIYVRRISITHGSDLETHPRCYILFVPSCMKQEYATFTYFPRIEQTAIGEARERHGDVGFGGFTVGAGVGNESSTQGHSLPAAGRPIMKIIRAGTYEDCEIPCGLSVHPQMNVRVGVIENLTGTNVRKSTGTLQVLDEDLISGNKILVLRPLRLEMPCGVSELQWPCTAMDIMQQRL